MIEATRKKLRETQFFLRLLGDEGRRIVSNEPEAFQFFLSAFLSAARSVTFALQSEEKAKYDVWFPTWLNQLTDEERDLLNFLRDERNREQKQGGAKVGLSYEFVSICELASDSPGRPVYTFVWAGPPGTPPPRVDRRKYEFNFGRGHEDVVTLCRKYATLLGRVVEDFIKTHEQ